MPEPYRHNVELYDRVHELKGKDYRAESDTVIEVVEATTPGASTLLDVACGTGRHLEFLSERFRCVGVDLNAAMLDVARNRVRPEVELFEANALTLNLDRTFDVVTCLFSSIGYMRPLAAMRGAMRNMVRHLAPGGVLIVEPWLTPETWDPDWRFGLDVLEDGDGRLVRMSREWVDDTTTFFEMHYLAGSADGVVYAKEDHALDIYTVDEYLEAANDAGCQADFDDYGLIGRGLIVGTKPVT